MGLHIDQPAQRRTNLLSLSTLAAMAVLAGCTAAEKLGLNPSETLTQGYVIDQQQIDQVPVGSSREQVILALGRRRPPRPSTTRCSTTFPRPVSGRSRFSIRTSSTSACLLSISAPTAVSLSIANYGLQGRQSVRLHLTHDADRRQGPELHRPDDCRRRKSSPVSLAGPGWRRRRRRLTERLPAG